LAQPGIYFGAFGLLANVGTGGKLGKRVSQGAHLSMLGEEDKIFAVIDRNNRLGVGDAKFAERLLSRAVEAQGELTLRNSLPKGEAVSTLTYAGFLPL
jgi:hypothetical protein